MKKLFIRTKDNTYEGLEMPSNDESVVMLKLANGYNIGLNKSQIIEIKKSEFSAPAQVTAKTKSNPSKPKITIIAIGGTIASRVDYRTGGVHALTNPEELVASIPELAQIANISVVSPFTLMSEDLSFQDWQRLATVVERELKNAEGVIVTQGTDTLHFTSAILSFMIQNLNKPVAVVGSQRSSDRGSSDAAQNLICATHYCLSDIAEVAVVMHGSTEDTYCLASQGTKVRKMHCSRRDAFRPINTLPLAKIFPNGNIEKLSPHNQRKSGTVSLKNKLEPNVALIKFTPGMGPEQIDFFVKQGVKGIIIEATGMGHVTTQPEDAKRSWISAIRRAAKKGVFVGVAPQCLYGAVNPNVYTNARLLQDAGAVFLNDILPETAYVKLAWALAQPENTKELMLQNVAGEYNNRIEEETFLY